VKLPDRTEVPAGKEEIYDQVVSSTLESIRSKDPHISLSVAVKPVHEALQVQDLGSISYSKLTRTARKLGLRTTKEKPLPPLVSKKLYSIVKEIPEISDLVLLDELAGCSGSEAPITLQRLQKWREGIGKVSKGMATDESPSCSENEINFVENLKAERKGGCDFSTAQTRLDPEMVSLLTEFSNNNPDAKPIQAYAYLEKKSGPSPPMTKTQVQSWWRRTVSRVRRSVVPWGSESRREEVIMGALEEFKARAPQKPLTKAQEYVNLKLAEHNLGCIGYKTLCDLAARLNIYPKKRRPVRSPVNPLDEAVEPTLSEP
jgi:hypothetical protein